MRPIVGAVPDRATVGEGPGPGEPRAGRVPETAFRCAGPMPRGRTRRRSLRPKARCVDGRGRALADPQGEAQQTEARDQADAAPPLEDGGPLLALGGFSLVAVVSAALVLPLGAVWVLCAGLAVTSGTGTPVAAASTADALSAQVRSVRTSMRDQKTFQASVAAPDPVTVTPHTELLGRLRGKDVLLVFVESYGRVAVEGSPESGPVVDLLNGTSATLRARVPTTSKSSSSGGNALHRAMAPMEGLKPTSPVCEAGRRVEPPPSVPSASGTMPAAITVAMMTSGPEVAAAVSPVVAKT